LTSILGWKMLILYHSQHNAKIHDFETCGSN